MSKSEANKIRDLQTRFWNKIDRRKADECWLWTGFRNKQGYGHFQINKQAVKAHRQMLVFCGVPIEGLVVMHLCDNPSCVNPAHLRAARQIENIKDCLSKGRRKYARGEKHINHKISAIQAREIKCQKKRVQYWQCAFRFTQQQCQESNAERHGLPNEKNPCCDHGACAKAIRRVEVVAFRIWRYQRRCGVVLP